VCESMSEAAPTCQLRIASTGVELVTAYARRHRWEIGRPITFDEQYSGITALEAFAGAFAADIINGLRLRAKTQRVEILQVEAVVKLWLGNPLTFLEVVGEGGDASIESLRLHLYVSTVDPEEAVRELLKKTMACSPLYLTVSKAARVHVDFEVAI
jgi:hypothetical protein